METLETHQRRIGDRHAGSETNWRPIGDLSETHYININITVLKFLLDSAGRLVSDQARRSPIRHVSLQWACQSLMKHVDVSDWSPILIIFS